ncbi:dexh-box atp-dependent rna helicase dexh17 [Quercus suber]|uniref:Dexh-box atp-dependent rna helicase dexh17 n=1 Tax=Quercus suber TaxID=58331 RepID=A0AAW0JEB7_QUESU
MNSLRIEFPIRMEKEVSETILFKIMDSYTLKSVLDLPAHFRSAFKFRYFNSLQSECFPVCFHSDANMVISAPTGSGKTVLFELCILRLLSKFISEDGMFVHIKGTLKTVSLLYQDTIVDIYIAPSKALVQEKLRDWNEKFGSWGINCLELTGDNEFYNIKNIQDADIVLTTPEILRIHEFSSDRVSNSHGEGGF